MDLATQVARRRTFAIISHPDAGKTTMTEKLLLYGGALHVAGAVKSRKAARHAVSDWMAMEQEKGISITSSVLQFDYRDKRMNLLDTPGHADFSEDTYRTLAAVDSAVMLIDVAKGVEPRTLTLFKVCRRRKMPVMTFVNKMDRPGLEPLELLDAVAQTLDIRTVPLNWPIGEGTGFRGVVDLLTHKAVLYERIAGGGEMLPEEIFDLDDPTLDARIGAKQAATLRDEIELVEEAGDDWDLEAYLRGELTPFFFGSAMTNQGVQPLLDALIDIAPPPLPRPTTEGTRSPADPDFSGFIFKIQANMNPRHRDRIAFMRVVSGPFERDMEVHVAGRKKMIKLKKPHTFVASERSIVEEAVPGDIVGLFDPGELRIGDTLYQGPPVAFEDIPRFAPEHFARVRLKDPTKRKHLRSGLTQLSHEGAIQLFVHPDLGPADPYLGAVGMLQFEVLKVRLQNEYNTAADLAPTNFRVARWVGGSAEGIDWLRRRREFVFVKDRWGRDVILAENPWMVELATTKAPGLELYEISPIGDTQGAS